ncbi:MAG: hypothetical protein AAF725_13360 [Acidobacteriota bacterium]
MSGFHQPRARRPRTAALALALLVAGTLGGAGPAPGLPATGASGLAETKAGGGKPAAYHLAKGSFARSRIVALGRDLWIEGEARSHAVVISGDARITGGVEGDLIVLAGTVRLGPKARVGGDTYVLGGDIEVAPGASIDGRSVAYPEASDLWIGLIQGPALGTPATSRVALGTKLALMAFWTFLAMGVLAISRRELVATSEAIQDEPFHLFFVGLTGVAALVLTALFFSAFSGALLGVPLLVLVAVVALVLRFWGMVAIFHALGSWLHRKLGKRPPLPLASATWGLLALGAAKFVPYLGIWSWSVATFIGVGAALSTKMGRREAWFA